MDTLANNVNNLPEERGWEYRHITVTRVPGYGFGIAVSGGRDNPHFASGDPSIAVSDVLTAGPAEHSLQVNDRIISVNGISLQNVDYATAVQVLRDSGDTVVLVIKRRTAHHQHSHSLSASYTGSPPLAALGINPLPPKVTLTKNSKKEDFGIVLGCKLFVKEISSKARDQLLNTNQYLVEGDFITKINNTNCSDMMSMKEAKKIIDGTKDKLHLTIARDSAATNGNSISHQTQSSVSTTGAVNNYYKGDDFLTNQSYSNQNLYVQPPTRNANINTNGGFADEKLDPNSGMNSLTDDKNNLAPRGRLRGPISDASLSQLDMGSYSRTKRIEEPPRPPPPRVEDYYSSRRQLFEDDPILQKTKQPVPDARFITFQKEGSVGIRLTGGNFAGIFVTAVQPGSPASLQGLQPGDKILKVNDMDMTGVTREEAVLFLLSLQDRIELIVQFCKEEYDTIVASQKGDSFYIKTHFHYENPAKGEMTFRSGDIFHVVDTLYNGVVGCWQVFRIGRNNQEVQKGIIPNKARAEELATAQFNATKKEMSANESRGSFFRRRRSNNRRSKSLGKEHWDDILFSDTVSKFPAYERVVLKHPGFTRPVILFGPIADVAREKLLKDYPDKFISPQLDSNMDDTKTAKVSSNIIRLSAIREVISTGKHALLDITPNAVERLNYAQLYPIVVFFKADTKIIIKQLRQGLPKSAHKSSKKLFEQCQKLDKVWNHIFCSTITLNDNTENWYRKVREIIDKQQSGALWMSESKPEESLSDDFLFPMSSLRLSYASSPESDLEHSPGPPVSLAGMPGTGTGNGRLTKASSDPSVVMPDSSTTDVLPPYQPTYDSRYGFSNGTGDQNNANVNQTNGNDPKFLAPNQEINLQDSNPQSPYKTSGLYSTSNHDYAKNEGHKRQTSTLHNHFNNYSKSHGLNEHSPRRSPKETVYGTSAPDLPPRIDRAVKPPGLLSTPTKNPSSRSAHERLFGTKAALAPENNDQPNAPSDSQNFISNKLGSLDRRQNSKSDSLSSYDSFNNPNKQRLGPNAHDDLKSSLPKTEPPATDNGSMRPRWDQNHRHDRIGSKLDLKYAMSPGEARSNDNLNVEASPRNSRELDKDMVPPLDQMNPPRIPNDRGHDIYRHSRSPGKQPMPSKSHVETKTDYGKYSRNNSSAQDYIRTSHQDLSQSHLSIHQVPQHHHSPLKSPNMMHHSNGLVLENGQLNHLGSSNGPPNTYKPVPPPKPKNYKPPYKNQTSSGYGSNENTMVGHPSMQYQHGKSHSNPVGDPRSPNYYYNMPPGQQHNNNSWHTETAIRYNTNMHGHYDMTSPYESRRHTSISYASRSEIIPMSQHESAYNHMDVNEGMMDGRPNPPEGRPSIVDLQGSREQRGSAFELYRKPIHHNMSCGDLEQNGAFYGTYSNITPNHASNTSAITNNHHTSPNQKIKISKTQSFKQTKSEGFSTPKLFRKLSFNRHRKTKDEKSNPNLGKKLTLKQTKYEQEELDKNHNPDSVRAGGRSSAGGASRDVTSAVVNHKGATLVNNYWGVTLEIPENALPYGVQHEIYFVITDPRTCENAPPLDLENGETMLSPLVMCGPQGIEFLKPVILNIPHYANTLPSLGISLKATDSEQNIHTDWDNILLPSNHAANSVAVKVDHF